MVLYPSPAQCHRNIIHAVLFHPKIWLHRDLWGMTGAHHVPSPCPCPVAIQCHPWLCANPHAKGAAAAWLSQKHGEPLNDSMIICSILTPHEDTKIPYLVGPKLLAYFQFTHFPAGSTNTLSRAILDSHRCFLLSLTML